LDNHFFGGMRFSVWIFSELDVVRIFNDLDLFGFSVNWMSFGISVNWIFRFFGIVGFLVSGFSGMFGSLVFRIRILVRFFWNWVLFVCWYKYPEEWGGKETFSTKMQFCPTKEKIARRTAFWAGKYDAKRME
jgi:hypothetical protein